MSDAPWRTLKAEREYRGCLLHVEHLGRGAGYAWAAHLPGFDVPLSEALCSRTLGDAQAVAEAAVDAVAAGLSEWVATGRTEWGEVADQGASIGGLMAMLGELASGRVAPALRLSLGTRSNVPRVEPAGALLPRSVAHRAFPAAHARRGAEALLRDLARAMGVDCGD